MRLSAAAKHFDNTTMVDAYGGAGAVRCQFDLFDDSRRDAYGVERRILSCGPRESIPARSALREPERDEVWLVGACQPDYFRGRQIRKKFVLHRADGLAHVRTPAELLEGQQGLQAYANAAWVKDAKQQEEESGAPGMYAVFFSRNEPVLKNCVVEVEGLTLWVRGRYESSADFLVAEAEDISGSLQPLAYRSRTYDPILDKNTDTLLTVQGLVLRWQTLYENSSDAALRVERGDRTVVVSKASVASPKAGDAVTGQYAWKVLSVEDRGSSWALQVRVV